MGRDPRSAGPPPGPASIVTGRLLHEDSRAPVLHPQFVAQTDHFLTDLKQHLTVPRLALTVYHIAAGLDSYAPAGSQDELLFVTD